MEKLHEPFSFLTYSLLLTSYFLLLTLILTFAVTFSYIAIQQHRTYNTNALDIGNVDQALWNTAQGCFLCFSLMTPVESRLALHVEPILLLFVPFYWLNLGSPELLLIAQATIVALGAWPLYQITNYELRITNYSLIFPLAYLLLPTLESAILYDFHAVTFAPTFILYAYHALISRHDKRYWFFIGLTLACKEDMPLLIAMLAIYIALAEHRPRLAATTLGLSAIWFITALFIIQPMFAAEGNIQLDRYDWLGSTPLDKIQTLLTQPRLIFDHVWVKANLPNYLFSLFFPTAFLALFSPMILLPMLPTLAINLLSDNPFTWRLEDFHYGAPLVPFIYIATIHTIKKLEMRSKKLEISHLSPLTSHFLFLISHLLLLTFSLFYHHQRGFTPLARPFNWPETSPHQAQLDRLIATIPPNITLFAQSNLAPHLTHRRFIYSDFAYFTDPAYPAPQPIEAILLDITTLENRGSLHKYLRDHLFQQSPYRLITAQDGLLYFQRTVTLNNNVLPLNSQFSILNSQFSLPTDFGQQIRLHGYSLHFNRQEEIQVTVELEILPPPDSGGGKGGVWPVLYLLDEHGQPLGATTDLPPMLVWYPPAQWVVGEHVQLRFNTLPWYSRDLPAYRLALGVIQGADVWNITQRLRPVISQTTAIAPHLAADGTLLQLAYIEQQWHIPTGSPLLRQFTLPNPAYPLETNINQPFSLLGYDAPTLNHDTLAITLYWQAHVINPPNLTRFAQLVGADGQLYGQQDSAPDNGQYPTNLWQQGEVVTEIVTLPLKSPRPAQNYTLHVGLYDPANGQRLPLTNGRDHVEIAVIQ